MIEISSEKFVCELSSDTPAAIEVEPGSTLKIYCRNALDKYIGTGSTRAEAANPGTGPIAVTGAMPGQSLKFDILDVTPESPGYVSVGWEGRQQSVDIRDGNADFHGIEIPIAPMIGVLGLAPDVGAWRTMDVGPYGGNMDVNDIAPGATVYLPIFRRGGRFIIGDVHAVMGDGEIGGQGLEVAATVTVRVDIEPTPLSDCIYIYRDDKIVTVAAAERIEDAVRDATLAMVRIVANAGDMNEFNAMKFLGIAGDTLFGQHCCRIKTVRVAVPLKYFPILRLSRP